MDKFDYVPWTRDDEKKMKKKFKLSRKVYSLVFFLPLQSILLDQYSYIVIIIHTILLRTQRLGKMYYANASICHPPFFINSRKRNERREREEDFRRFSLLQRMRELNERTQTTFLFLRQMLSMAQLNSELPKFRFNCGCYYIRTNSISVIWAHDDMPTRHVMDSSILYMRLYNVALRDTERDWERYACFTRQAFLNWFARLNRWKGGNE